MFNIQAVDRCDECLEWGSTIIPDGTGHHVQCSKCGRFTWPNLGVNCPAGSAVSFCVRSVIPVLPIRDWHELYGCSREIVDRGGLDLRKIGE